MSKNMLSPKNKSLNIFCMKYLWFSKHKPNTFQTPSRYPSDIFQEPISHSPDEFPTPSRHPPDAFKTSLDTYRVSQKMRLAICLISRQPSIGFPNPYTNFEYKTISVLFQRAEIFTKQNAVLKQIDSYSYRLIVATKPQKLSRAPATGPRRALIAPKGLLVGLVTQTD